MSRLCLFIKALVAHIGAVKGMSWESPRGPMTIDPETRDVIHNIYLRRVAQRMRC
jgi:branched-chain amino acid transport system substrate-binding protein